LSVFHDSIFVAILRGIGFKSSDQIAFDLLLRLSLYVPRQRIF
jgi:hypothetical protein